MVRLWRTVVVVGLCFAAVVAMRMYLNQQIELVKATIETGSESGTVVPR